MWELDIGLIGFVVVLGAAVVQVALEYFFGERSPESRRCLAYILGALVIVGALANEWDDRQKQTEERQERQRVEQEAKDREEQAQKDRDEALKELKQARREVEQVRDELRTARADINGLSKGVRILVAEARKRDPSLSEEDALRTILTELQTLRDRALQQQRELEGVRQYGEIAKRNVFGLEGRARPGSGLREDSAIARALDGAFNEVARENGSVYIPRCDAAALTKFENVIRQFPDFPFSYWALAQCLKPMGNSQWRKYAERAMSIFEHTTRFGVRNPDHDQARQQIEEMLTEQ